MPPVGSFDIMVGLVGSRHESGYARVHGNGHGHGIPHHGLGYGGIVWKEWLWRVFGH